jgi:hypothetical protein
MMLRPPPRNPHGRRWTDAVGSRRRGAWQRRTSKGRQRAAGRRAGRAAGRARRRRRRGVHSRGAAHCRPRARRSLCGCAGAPGGRGRARVRAVLSPRAARRCTPVVVSRNGPFALCGSCALPPTERPPPAGARGPGAIEAQLPAVSGTLTCAFSPEGLPAERADAPAGVFTRHPVADHADSPREVSPARPPRLGACARVVGASSASVFRAQECFERKIVAGVRSLGAVARARCRALRLSG